jgi:hypothetical protein
MASPFDFINAANNMAAFYVAKLAGLRARNLTVTQEEFSFEWALKLAVEDLRAGRYRQALVGGVDENSQPRTEHLRRIALRDDQWLGEGAGFLYLACAPRAGAAEILGVRHRAAPDPAAALTAGITEWRRAHEPVTVLPGFRLTVEQTSALAAVPGVTVARYIDWCGGFHTAAAFGLAVQLESPGRRAGLILHINTSADGHCMLVGLRCPAD